MIIKLTGKVETHSNPPSGRRTTKCAVVMEQDRDMMVNNMMAITGSESVSEIISVLENHEWNFEAAVQTYLASQTPTPTKPHVPPRSRFKRSRDSPDHTPASKRAKQDSAPFPPSAFDDDENVPAPIPIRRERLIDDHPPAFQVKRIRAPFADFAARPPRRSAQATQDKVNALGEIFKSPDEILFRGTFDEVKREGQSRKKWILVNILDYQDFKSICMNRDTWSDGALQQYITKHFIFWQTDAQLSDDYQRLYPVATFPHTAVLHPTGEQRLYHCGGLSAQEILVGLKSIIQESANPFQSGYKPTMDFDDVKPTSDLTEEQQLELAIKASLEKSEASYEDQSPDFFVISDEEEEFSFEPDDDDENDDSLQILDRPPNRSVVDSTPTSAANPVVVPSPSPPPIESPKISAVVESTVPSPLPPVSSPKGYTPEKEATCRLRIRMPDGKNVNGCFSDQDTVKDLFDFIRTHKQAPSSIAQGDQFTLHTPPQRFLRKEHFSQTLKEAELAPRSAVFVNLT